MRRKTLKRWWAFYLDQNPISLAGAAIGLSVLLNPLLRRWHWFECLYLVVVFVALVLNAAVNWSRGRVLDWKKSNE